MLGIALAAALVGLIAGHIALALLLALFVYLVWHLVQLFRLERWLREAKKLQPPDSWGIWGDVFHHIYRLQQRNRKRKRQLAAMLDRFQEATTAMPDATVVLRTNGEIEWFNDAAERLLGLRSPQDVGQRFTNLVRDPVFIRYLAGDDYAESVEFPSPIDKQMMLAVHIVPYGKEERLLLARDITRLHKLEQVRRDFVANVSHELRTPLTVMAGFLETLADENDECARKWKRSLHLMTQQSGRMQRIVDDLLLLSRLEIDKPTHANDPVAVPGMLAGIREDALALSGERHHRIALEADAELWVRGNEEELRSAFSNLVFNAVQYTPERGEVHMRWYADATGAHLEVRDTGVGIEAHHIPRLTERFYRVDVGRSRGSGGTGLGLAIVKHVLNRHNAKLRIASESGKGSTFACDFPPAAVVRRHLAP